MDELTLASFVLLVGGFVHLNRLKANEKVRKRRRWQIRPINQQRWKKSEYLSFLDMKNNDSEQFCKYTRMNPNQFEELLCMIKPKIEKCHAKALPAEMKLAMTLRYLTQGGTMQSVALSYRVGLSTVSVVIKEVCVALWEILNPQYVKVPDKKEWLRNAAGFWRSWNVPLCLGICKTGYSPKI